MYCLLGVFRDVEIMFKSSLKSTWNERGYFNGGGFAVSKINQRSTGVNVLSTPWPNGGTCLVDFNH